MWGQQKPQQKPAGEVCPPNGYFTFLNQGLGRASDVELGVPSDLVHERMFSAEVLSVGPGNRHAWKTRTWIQQPPFQTPLESRILRLSKLPGPVSKAFPESLAFFSQHSDAWVCVTVSAWWGRDREVRAVQPRSYKLASPAPIPCNPNLLFWRAYYVPR